MIKKKETNKSILYSEFFLSPNVSLNTVPCDWLIFFSFLDSDKTETLPKPLFWFWFCSVLLCCNWTNQPLLYPNFRHHHNPNSQKWKPLSKKKKNGNVGIWVWFLDLESWVSLWWTCCWFHQRLSTSLLPRFRFSLFSHHCCLEVFKFITPECIKHNSMICSDVGFPF